MYTLGIPDRQKRRTLGYLKQQQVDFEENPSMEGFFDVGFPLISTGKIITFNFKPGLLLIFPGFLPHEVPINKSNNRLIVSGNLK